MARRPFMAGNWKMYKTIPESLELVRQLKVKVSDARDRDIVVCPTFTALRAVRELIKESNIALGAQNLYPENEGAFTGEISPPMLIDCGVNYVILGHSERRQYFSESDQFINKKVKCAIAASLKPIVCVGEVLEQREQGITEEVVKSQVRGALDGLDPDLMKSVVIAYEPVWAIGTGKTATPGDANAVHSVIRGLLMDIFGEETSESTRIIYGGSVKPENVDALMAEKHIDGALVGGASLKPDSFARIVKFA